MLADEIDDAPPAVALLDMRERERRDFGSPQPAAEKNSEDRAIAQAPDVEMSGAFRSVCACRSDSQLPTRMPVDFALFTRAMPAASSGASRPLSAASAASLRIADIRTMIDDEPSLRSSSDTRHALTVALVKPGRGACWNQA